MILGAAACGSETVPELGSVASRYIRLTRELARHDPSLIDHWLREPPPLDGARRPVPDLATDVDALAADARRALAADPRSDRAAHLVWQIDALALAARRLLGESPSFDEEARLGLGLEALRADEAVERARAALDHELAGPEPLVSRVIGFRQRFVVSEGTRETVMRAALEQCREATREFIPLPPDESIELAFVEHLPWDAHARYLGAHRTRIEVNAGQPFDLARALRLACHEGYPGHHVQYLWLDDEVVGRRGWAEFALVPGFGPDLLLSEGSAEAGASLAMPFARRVQVYRDHLAPAGGLQAADVERLARVEEHLAAIEGAVGAIARDYLDNRITTATAVSRLSDEALIADAEAFSMFIERRRTRLLAYPEGRRLVLERIGAEGLTALPPLLVKGLAR